MTDLDSNVEPMNAPRRSNGLDTWLNVVLIVLLLAMVGGAGYFGYSVYQEKQREYASSAAGRVAVALASQVRKAPNDAILRVRLGEALGASGKYPEAIEQLNAALKINPKHTGALFDLGTIAMITKNYDQAKRYYTKVIDVTDAAQYTNVNPQREQAYYNLGLLALDGHKYPEAAGYFKASLRIRKDASDTYYRLAQALFGMGDKEGALQNLEIAVQFDPSFADAHYLMGRIYRDKKDDVNASFEFSRAAVLAPTAEEPKAALAQFGTAASWIQKARTAQTSGDIEKALVAVLVARNLDSKSLPAAKLHAEILVKRGDRKDALDVYRQALVLDPKDAAVKAKIAELEPIVKAAAAKRAKSRKKK
jgi:tetratricopeptide (TPR) repeat protein